MDNPAKTPIAPQQNVAQRVSSKKQLSTKTADRHAHAKIGEGGARAVASRGPVVPGPPI